VKFVLREIGEIVRYLPDRKKFACLSRLSLLRRSRPKSVRASPQQCTQSYPDFIQSGSLSVESYYVTCVWARWQSGRL